MRSFWISAAAREISPFPLPAPEVPESSGRILLTPCSFAQKKRVPRWAAGASQIYRGSRSVSKPTPSGLPFADASFDLVTTAFGFRNLSQCTKPAARNSARAEPGGTIAILEFTEHRWIVGGSLSLVFLPKFLPKIGGLISGDSAAYSYLPNPWPVSSVHPSSHPHTPSATKIR